jgi:hypothetical protein
MVKRSIGQPRAEERCSWKCVKTTPDILRPEPVDFLAMSTSDKEDLGEPKVTLFIRKTSVNRR